MDALHRPLGQPVIALRLALMVGTMPIRLPAKIGGHPEQAPRGRRRGGAQSKDPVGCKTDARTSWVLSRDASTPFRLRLRPRRNSAQHDLDLERKTSHTPGKLTGNRTGMVGTRRGMLSGTLECGGKRQRHAAFGGDFGWTHGAVLCTRVAKAVSPLVPRFATALQGFAIAVTANSPHSFAQFRETQ